MEHSEPFVETFLLSGAILLGMAVLFVLPFRRLGLGAVLGYLLAGVLVGPQVLGLVGASSEQGEQLMSFSEIGIVLLLFLVGLELSPKRLWLMRKDIFVLGPAQVVMCGLMMVAAVLAFTGFSMEAAIVIGLPLGLSSTAQVLPLLQSGGRLSSAYGQKSFSILLFQDLSLVPLLTIVAALSRAPAPEGTASGPVLILYAIGAIAALVLAGRYLLNPLLGLIGKVAERELFIVVGLFTVCASAALMTMLGLSAALGAFVAGVVLAESPYRHELEADVDPFRSLLLGLFFLSVGMMLDLGVIAERPITILAFAALLVGVKVLIIYSLARLFRLSHPDSLIMAMLLSQGGEFAFVLFGAAETALLIDPQAVSLFSAVVTLSMASTPFLMMLTRRISRAEPHADTELTDPEQSDHSEIIIVGHGRFGQVCTQILEGSGFSVTLIDINPQQIGRSSSFGRKVFYGDGSRIDLLRRAGAEHAAAILFCHDDRSFDSAKLEAIKHSFPDTMLIARAYDRVQSISMIPAGGVRIVREVYESAIRMAARTMLALDHEEERVRALVADFRDRDLRRLRMQLDEGDLRAGMDTVYGATFDDGAETAGEAEEMPTGTKQTDP